MIVQLCSLNHVLPTIGVLYRLDRRLEARPRLPDPPLVLVTPDVCLNSTRSNNWNI